jgi:hypothetical protein
MKKTIDGFSVYVVMFLISYYVISGITFAGFHEMFGGRKGLYTQEEALRNCRQHLGMALGWSALAAGLWPFFLPGVYLASGFAHDGVWTKYPISTCRQYQAT